MASPQEEEKRNESPSFDAGKEEKKIDANATAEEQLGQKYIEDAKRVDAGGVSAGYERKVFLLNKVMQEEIGMGKVSCGN